MGGGFANRVATAQQVGKLIGERVAESKKENAAA